MSVESEAKPIRSGSTLVRAILTHHCSPGALPRPVEWGAMVNLDWHAINGALIVAQHADLPGKPWLLDALQRLEVELERRAEKATG